MLTIIEMSSVALVMAIWISQIVLPIVRGTPLFPLFKRETRLRHSLLVAEQHILEKHLAEELKQKESHLSEEKSDEEKV